MFLRTVQYSAVQYRTGQGMSISMIMIIALWRIVLCSKCTNAHKHTHALANTHVNTPSSAAEHALQATEPPHTIQPTDVQN